MASKRTLVFVTMLFCLSCSTSITAQNLSKHIIIENGSDLLGFTRGSQAIQSAGNSSSGRSIKAEQMSYFHYAGYQSMDPHGAIPPVRWHGVRARLSMWEIPHVQPLSSSGAYIAAVNESPVLEYILAGFHVNPSLYNDNDVHFFTHWSGTGDYSTGCYNNYCQGFIVANYSNLYPGQPFHPPFSTYGGEQRGITIRIKRDESTGDWLLYREDLGGAIDDMTLIGRWPGTLFKYLSNHAEVIQWKGFVSYNYNERSPAMGSGHFSSEFESKAASFIDCFGFFENGDVYEGFYNPISSQDIPACYDVSQWYETQHAARRHFFYGGPGGCYDEK